MKKVKVKWDNIIIMIMISIVTICFVSILCLLFNGYNSIQIKKNEIEPTFETEIESLKYQCTLNYLECDETVNSFLKMIEPPQNLAVDGKGITYTSVNSPLNHDYLYLSEDEYYIDEDGFARENDTDAILVAMGSAFEKGNYYEIILSNGKSEIVIVQDIKADSHTDKNNIYTTDDNSIVEPWIDENKAIEFADIGNSLVLDITVSEIYNYYIDKD